MSKWKFPLTNGGQEDGFNDPGVSTFAGDFEKYLARETIQNVIDAKCSEETPVKIRFQLRNIEASKIPGHAELVQVFKSCAQYYPNDKKCTTFFETGLGLLANKTIPVLSVSDFNTTGLVGSDTDRNGNWYALIRSIGSSQKSSDAGGSFGIGKNAPFAASVLRTVFYSTKVEDASVAFQGVARLITHLDGSNKPTQGTGYFGQTDADDYPIAIRDESKVPAFFKRAEQGTDVHIIGYAGGDTWKKELERATLEHFWPAIHWGRLAVEIGDDIVIDSTTLQEKMAEARAADESFYEVAYAYYNAYVRPDHEATKDLKHLKEVRVAYKIGDADLPNRVAMIRKTGMVIFTSSFPRLRIKFAGAFICDNEHGNSLLRSMEPPRHNKWDVNLPQKGAGLKVEREYREWLRGILKAHIPTSDAQVLDVDELADYLPDSPTSEAGSEKGEMSDGKADPFTDNPTEIDSPRIMVMAPPQPVRNQTSSTTSVNHEGTGANGAGAEGGGENSGNTDGGDEGDGGTTGGGKKEGDDESDKQPKGTGAGGASKPSKKKPASLVSRAFADTACNEYVIYLRSDTDTTVGVSIIVVGEDAFTERITLLKARDRDTNEVIAVSGNSLEEVKLTANTPRRVAVSFGDSVHYAVNLNVYEI